MARMVPNTRGKTASATARERGFFEKERQRQHGRRDGEHQAARRNSQHLQTCAARPDGNPCEQRAQQQAAQGAPAEQARGNGCAVAQQVGHRLLQGVGLAEIAMERRP